MVITCIRSLSSCSSFYHSDSSIPPPALPPSLLPSPSCASPTSYSPYFFAPPSPKSISTSPSCVPFCWGACGNYYYYYYYCYDYYSCYYYCCCCCCLSLSSSWTRSSSACSLARLLDSCVVLRCWHVSAACLNVNFDVMSTSCEFVSHVVGTTSNNSTCSKKYWSYTWDVHSNDWYYLL